MKTKRLHKDYIKDVGHETTRHETLDLTRVTKSRVPCQNTLQL